MMRSILFAAVVVSLVSSAPAQAAGFRPWAGLTGSWGTYVMSDVNQNIREANALIAGSGLSMDEIKNGLGLGATLAGDFAGGATIGIAYDRLFASTDVADASAKLTYDLGANAFRAFGEYRLPSTTWISPRIGVAGGLVSTSGSIALSITGGGGATNDVTGTGPLFEGYAGGDWWTAPQFAVTGSLGYRYAKVGEVKIQDQTAYNLDGSKRTADYSGFIARLGVKVAFTP
jgi:hypothetical protein